VLGWFRNLCAFTGVKGEAKVYFKLKGKKNKTNLSAEEAWEGLKQGLKDEKQAFIYHAYNHYMCPVGYEEMPLKPEQVFKRHLVESEQTLMVADNSMKHPTVHCLKW